MLNAHHARTSIWRLTPFPVRRRMWELKQLQQPRSYSQLKIQGVHSIAHPSSFPGHGTVERNCASYGENKSKLPSVHVIGTR